MTGTRPLPTRSPQQEEPRAARSENPATDPRGKPYDVDALLEQGMALCQNGRFSEGESAFRRILEIEPGHCETLHFLGMVCSQLGNHADALRHIDAALQIKAEAPAVHSSRGNVLAALKRFDEALASFDTAIALDPYSPMVFSNRGNAQLELGQLEEAVASYDRALALDPDDAEAYYGRGSALAELGRLDEAVASYDRAIAIRSDYTEAFNNRGVALQDLKRFDEALASYDRAIALKPDFAEAWSNRGAALQELKRLDEALASYDKAIAFRPDYAEAFDKRGSALVKLGRFEDALANYDKAIAFKPDYAEAFSNRGNALRKLRRFDEELASYDKAIAIKSEYVEALTARGHALMRVGRDSEAAEAFNGLVRRGTHSIDVLLALSTVPTSLIKVDLMSELRKNVPVECEDKTHIERAAFAFVRAAALDAAGCHAEAWEQLALANRTMFPAAQEQLGTEIAAQRATLDRLRNHPAEAAAGSTHGDQVLSLFILGPSRSGKTTLERLVGTLPGVRRDYESPGAVDDAVRRTLEANALPSSTRFEDLPPALHPPCRDVYADEVARHAGSAKVCTNTRPGRIHTAGLMAAIFPSVRFLCIKRNIEDTVLRIYQCSYRRGNVYAYDLKTARDYVVWYHEAIDLLHEKFPDLVRVIHYEDMVADPAVALTAAADLCGLPMTDRPLPAVGDDRGCAAPYRQLMAAELAR